MVKFGGDVVVDHDTCSSRRVAKLARSLQFPTLPIQIHSAVTKVANMSERDQTEQTQPEEEEFDDW